MPYPTSNGYFYWAVTGFFVGLGLVISTDLIPIVLTMKRTASYIFAAKNPDACVGDESRINKVKRIFFLYCPEKKGLFFRVKIFPSKNMISCVKDQ